MKTLQWISFILMIFMVGIDLHHCFSQSADSTFQVQTTLEEIAGEMGENNDQEIDFENLLAEIRAEDQMPDLNTISSEELKRRFHLNESQIEHFEEYRTLHGPILSVYELQLIEGFDRKTLERISGVTPFTGPLPMKNIPLKTLLTKGRHELVLTASRVLEKQQGFGSSADTNSTGGTELYRGNPFKTSFRYRFVSFDRIRAGISLEKDPGEVFFYQGGKKGTDFQSAYLTVQHFKFIETFILGDYEASFGQGLTLCTGATRIMKPLGSTIKKRNRGLRPHTSLSEYSFFRGAGATLQYKDLQCSVFYSVNNMDGKNIQTDTITGTAQVLQPVYTGLHRTEDEQLAFHTIRETLTGAHLTFTNDFLRIGWTAFHTRYNAKIINGTTIYRQFDFNADHNLNLGMDMDLLIKGINLFGEISVSQNKALAYLAGAIIPAGSYMMFSILYRHYDKSYQNLYSRALGRNSSNQNEEGLFMGLTASLFPGLRVTANVDYYMCPWLKSGSLSPSRNASYDVTGEWTLTRMSDLLFSYGYDLSTRTFDRKDLPLDPLVNLIKHKIRLHFSQDLPEGITLVTRIEMVKTRKGGERFKTGSMVAQDFIYRPVKIPVVINFRYALFDTETYDERIYSYEHDALYSFSVPAYYDRGTRFYIMIKANPIRHFDIWIRFARTIYFDKNTTGSGLDATEGNRRSEIKLQLRCRL